MLTKQDFEELLTYRAEHPVLSIYLNTDPVRGNDGSALARLRAMLRNVEANEDAEAVLRYMQHEHDGSGRSMALFSCAAEDFFRVYPLAVPVQDRIRYYNRPHVKPLTNLLDRYGHYGVALVDRQGARFFSFHLGELQEQEGVMGEIIHRTKRGGASQLAGRRGGSAGQTNHTGALTERNMKRAADAAAEFFTAHKVRRVLLGGTEESIALFRQYLPKYWQSLIVGSFPMSMTASPGEVLAQAMEIVEQQDQQQERLLVQSAITAAAKGRDGAIGLDDTLEAARTGRVHTLLVSENYHHQGYQCRGCSYTTTQRLEVCPFCGESFTPLPDAVEYAIRQVMQSGGEVEIVHAVPALQEAGH
ncbi:MAG: hypothetical protein D6755_01940, partial [Anaerolineae bacterium]